MDNLSEKALGIIGKKGNLAKEMKQVTPSRMREITEGLKKAGLAEHKGNTCSLTAKGMKKLKKDKGGDGK